MNYELALKLKEAGFPQDIKQGEYGYAESDLENIHGWINFSKGERGLYDGSGEYGIGNAEEGFIREPSLEQLIEECGDKLKELKKFFNDVNGTTYWIAYSPVKNRLFYVQGRGDIPKEAVANLWLSTKGKIIDK